MCMGVVQARDSCLVFALRILFWKGDSDDEVDGFGKLINLVTQLFNDARLLCTFVSFDRGTYDNVLIIGFAALTDKMTQAVPRLRRGGGLVHVLSRDNEDIDEWVEVPIVAGGVKLRQFERFERFGRRRRGDSRRRRGTGAADGSTTVRAIDELKRCSGGRRQFTDRVST